MRTVNPELVIVEAAVTAQSFELGPRASRKGRIGDILKDVAIEKLGKE